MTPIPLIGLICLSIVLSLGAARLVTSHAGRTAFVAAFAAILSFLLLTQGVSPADIGLTLGDATTTILVTVAGAAGLILLDIVGLWRLSSVADETVPGIYAVMRPQFQHEESFGTMLLLFWACAAWEELLYRGTFALLGQMVFASDHAGVLQLVIGAAVFALAHVRDGIADAVYPFGYGLIFGALYLVSGSLLPPIIAHASGNSFVYLYSRRILKRRIEDRAFFF